MSSLQDQINLEKSNQYLHCDFFSERILHKNSPDFFSRILYAHYVRAHFPFQLHLKGNTDTYLFVYNRKGQGKIHYQGKAYHLYDNQVILIPSREDHSFSIYESRQWNFIYLYLQGSFIEKTLAYYQLEDFRLSSDAKLDFLASQISLPSFRNLNEVEHNLFVTELLSHCLKLHQSSLNKEVFLPSYLLEIRKEFTNSCEASYQLDEIAKKHAVSKSKLLRDFHHYIGMSPIVYLTHLRLQRAKELLESTSLPIYSIASLVGLANTNHFIHLFKKNIGMTPFQYRKNSHTD